MTIGLFFLMSFTVLQHWKQSEVKFFNNSLFFGEYANFREITSVRFQCCRAVKMNQKIIQVANFDVKFPVESESAL